MSKLAVQAGPEKRSVARYVRLCFFSVTGKFIPQNYACAATCLTCQSRVKLHQNGFFYQKVNATGAHFDILVEDGHFNFPSET